VVYLKIRKESVASEMQVERNAEMDTEWDVRQQGQVRFSMGASSRLRWNMSSVKGVGLHDTSSDYMRFKRDCAPRDWMHVWRNFICSGSKWALWKSVNSPHREFRENSVEIPDHWSSDCLSAQGILQHTNFPPTNWRETSDEL
jgi:hypothetical protein